MAHKTGTDRHERRTSPSSGQRRNDDSRAPQGSDAPELERREVRSTDPQFSPHTNERITAELQDAVGAARVDVPRDRLRATAGEHPKPKTLAPHMNPMMLIFMMGLASVFVIAVIIALTSATWWLLAVAFFVLVLGLAMVVGSAIQVQRDVDRPSPTLAAAMQEEGSAFPDTRFSEMVEEFRAPDAEHRPDWEERRTVTPQQDPVNSSVEQSHSVTPGSQRSEPVPGGEDPNSQTADSAERRPDS